MQRNHPGIPKCDTGWMQESMAVFVKSVQRLATTSSLKASRMKQNFRSVISKPPRDHPMQTASQKVEIASEISPTGLSGQSRVADSKFRMSA
jgi:hypothetical protein